MLFGMMKSVLEIAWKALLVVGGWMLLKYLLRNGGEVFKEIIKTIGIVLMAAMVIVRKTIAKALGKEVEPERKPEPTEEGKAEEAKPDSAEEGKAEEKAEPTFAELVEAYKKAHPET